MYEPLAAAHAVALFPALGDPRVTEHIGGVPRTQEEMTSAFARMAAGPPASRTSERWVNFAVRLAFSEDYIGRIEATCYGTWAEVAYVFGAAWWGKGYACEAMRWFQGYLMSTYGIAEFWAAVGPGNARSVALLARLDYRAAAVDATRALASYEPGDLCFRRFARGVREYC